MASFEFSNSNLLYSKHKTFKETMWLSGKTNSTYIFQGWETEDPKELVLAITTTAAMTLLYEGLRAVVQFKERLWDNRTYLQPRTFPMALHHCVLSIIYALQTTIVCFLALSILTYNVWILFSIGVTSGIGFLLIRPAVSYVIMRRRGEYHVDDIEQPLFYETSSTPEKVRHSCVISRPNLHISNITVDSDEQWSRIRQMYRHASESRRFLSELRRRHPSHDTTLDRTFHSARTGLQWQYEDQMGGFSETLSTDNWLHDASWDATLDVLASGYVGREGSPVSPQMLTSPSNRPDLVPMYVTVV